MAPADSPQAAREDTAASEVAGTNEDSGIEALAPGPDSEEARLEDERARYRVYYRRYYDRHREAILTKRRERLLAQRETVPRGKPGRPRVGDRGEGGGTGPRSAPPP